MPNVNINRRTAIGSQKRKPFSFGNVAQYLSGVVGNEMVDISGNGYNADIINKDFYINGIPYKSAALIAQKAANFGLIPDPTNFWFTAGVPNQIPVVSLFENIDYANQIFCRHQSQLLNSNNEEAIEPKVIEIVTYSSALTGVNLTNANTYFNVSSAAVGAVYVPGDYATNTDAIAAVVAGSTIYNKSGVKTEAAQLLPNKLITIPGIGYSVNNYGGAPSSLVYITAICTLKRLIFNGNATVGFGFRLFSNTCVLEKVKMSNMSAANGYFKETGTGLTIKDSIFIQSVPKSYFLSESAPDILVTGCYINGYFTAGMFGYAAGITETQTVQYCKIITTSHVLIFCTALVFNFNYNNLSVANITDIFAMSTANSTLNVKYNNTIGTGTTDSNGAYIFHSFPATGSFNFEYNRHTTNDGLGLFFFANASKDSVVRGNYVRLLKCDVSYTAISSSALIELNTFVSYGTGDSGSITSISVSSAVGLTDKNVIIQKNKVLNPRYFNSALGGYHDCIYIRDYINTITKYNFVSGSGTANIIVKSTVAMDNTECPVMYNISHLNGILAKGQGYVKIYNNTVVDANIQYGIGMMSADDSSLLKTTYVKNNIVVNAIDTTPLIKIFNEDPSYPHIIDYNVYYSTSSTPFMYQGVSKTFTEWKALGYDANSVMLTSAQFSELFEDYASGDFRTKTSYLVGENLGVAYDDGLDKSTDFGTDNELPVVVTKQQPTAWQCGAYIL